jgi:hypothetical protein
MGGRGGTVSGGGGGAVADLPEGMSVNEANGMIDTLSGKLTPSEKDALTAYQRGSDELVNNTLRGIRKDNTPEEKAEAKKLTGDLRSAIEKSPGLERETLLYRGVGKDAVKGFFDGVYGGEMFFSKNPIGQVITDKGFQSTAFSKKAFDERFGKSDVVLKIVAPAGTKGVPMNQGWSKKTGMEHEKEFLMKPGAKYKIVSVRKLTMDRVQFTVELQK